MFQILVAATGKARRKSEGWHNETVGARGAQRTLTRHTSNVVEWFQIPGRDATENFVGQHGDLVFYSLRDPQPMIDIQGASVAELKSR